jgi:hypothetical protein
LQEAPQPLYRFLTLNRSVIVALLVFSLLLVILDSESPAAAVLVSSTTTQTATSYLTLTGTGPTTLYQTLTQVSSVPTVTGTTYTTTGVTMVPVQVLATVTYAGTSTATLAGVGCAQAPGQPQTCTTYPMAPTAVVYYSTQTGWAMAYSLSTVQGAVTMQQTTNIPTTVFSTSASTATHATGQVVSITATQTFTSVSEQPPSSPTASSISDLLMQNFWAVLVLFAVVLGVLGFRLGRRGGRGSSRVSAASGFCSSCGFRLTLDSQFCPKCGARRISANEQE